MAQAVGIGRSAPRAREAGERVRLTPLSVRGKCEGAASIVLCRKGSPFHNRKIGAPPLHLLPRLAGAG
jgi:hypothetical protein